MEHQLPRSDTREQSRTTRRGFLRAAAFGIGTTTVPRQLEETAWLDGRGKLRALFEIVVPVAAPGIAVVAGLSFLNAWSEVLMILILVDRPEMLTVPLAFYQTFRTSGGYTEVRYELIAAMAVLYLLPIMLLFLATRTFLVKGMTATTRGL